MNDESIRWIDKIEWFKRDDIVEIKLESPFNYNGHVFKRKYIITKINGNEVTLKCLAYGWEYRVNKTSIFKIGTNDNFNLIDYLWKPV